MFFSLSLILFDCFSILFFLWQLTSTLSFVCILLNSLAFIHFLNYTLRNSFLLCWRTHLSVWGQLIVMLCTSGLLIFIVTCYWRIWKVEHFKLTFFFKKVFLSYSAISSVCLLQELYLLKLLERTFSISGVLKLQWVGLHNDQLIATLLINKLMLLIYIC